MGHGCQRIAKSDMKILLINTLYQPFKVGGAEKSVQILAEELSADNEVHVLTLRPGNELPKCEIINNVFVHRLKLMNIYWPFPKRERPIYLGVVWHVFDTFNFLMMLKTWRLIKKISPDVIHTNNLLGFSIAVWVAARLAGKPIAHTTRDYYLLCPKSSCFKGIRRCHTRCVSCSVLCAPRIIASKAIQHNIGISRFISDQHNRYGLFAKNTDNSIIYNVVKNGGRCVAKLPPKTCRRIGYIGNISPPKGTERLLNLAKDLIETRGQDDFEFFIAGDGDPGYLGDLREAFSSEKIQFLGRVEAGSFFKNIDLLVVPSEWDEPFGRVVIEAYSYQVPVLVAKRGGLQELVHPEYVIDFDGCPLDQFNKKLSLIESEGYKLKKISSDTSYSDIYSSLLKKNVSRKNS